MRRSPLPFALAAGALLVAASPGCTTGAGGGRIVGSLDVPSCWKGPFELTPDFFGAVPYRDGMQLRVQSGSDFQNFSDGLSILLYDIRKIRPDPATGAPGRYNQPIPVELPPEVTPPGVPVTPQAEAPLVGMTLYLQRSCQTQNITLHAVEEVSFGDDGACDAPAVLGADPLAACARERARAAGVGTGKSMITFTSVANGRLDEETAAERLTAGCFDVYLADPHEVPPGEAGGGLGPPPRCRGHVKGTFSFFFERGRPAQPFP